LTHRTHTSQTEDSQPYNRAVQSITTDKEDKDIEAKGNKKVKIIETDKSENKQVKAGQKTGQFHENFKQA
jgi:flagellar basal body rod protein FlgC